MVDVPEKGGQDNRPGIVSSFRNNLLDLRLQLAAGVDIHNLLYLVFDRNDLAFAAHSRFLSDLPVLLSRGHACHLNNLELIFNFIIFIINSYNCL